MQIQLGDLTAQYASAPYATANEAGEKNVCPAGLTATGAPRRFEGPVCMDPALLAQERQDSNTAYQQSKKQREAFRLLLMVAAGGLLVFAPGMWKATAAVPVAGLLLQNFGSSWG